MRKNILKKVLALFTSLAIIFGLLPTATLSVTGANPAFSLTADFTVNTTKYCQSIVGLPNDKMAVLFYTSVYASGSYTVTYYLSIYGKDGNVLLNEINISALMDTKYRSEECHLLALSNGNIAVAYGRADSSSPIWTGSESRPGAYFMILDQLGNKVLGQTKINATDPGTSLSRSISMTQLSNGNIAFSWQRNDNISIATRVFKLDGTAATSETILVSGNAITSEVSAGSDGSYMVAYANYAGSTYTYYYKLLDSNGTVLANNSVGSGNSIMLSMKTLPNGNYMYGLYSYNTGKTSVYLFNSSGASQGTFMLNGAMNDGSMAISRAPGAEGFVLLSYDATSSNAINTAYNNGTDWTGTEYVYFKYYDNNGVLQYTTASHVDTGSVCLQGWDDMNWMYDIENLPSFSLYAGYSRGFALLKNNAPDNINRITSLKLFDMGDSEAAPSVTATGETPVLVQDNIGGVDLFSSVTASTNDNGQTFTGATMTVTDVSDPTEYLTVGGTDIPLLSGASGSFPGGFYSVAVTGGTATVTLSGMSLDNEAMGTLIDGILYKNSGVSVTVGNRTVTLTSVIDSGDTVNSASPDISAIVTIAKPAAAQTQSAGNISATAATLNGTVNANNATTFVSFECGTTTAYGLTVSALQSPITGTTDRAVSVPLNGLLPNTTYHFRVKAVNTAGTTYGSDFTFTTSAIAPAVQTLDASSISATAATLNGTVNANNASSVVTFEYGTTSAYGTTVTAVQSPVTGTTAKSVNYSLSGLTPNTTYHFRVKAVNSTGTSYGNDFTFTTPAISATAQTLDAESVSSTGAVLNGTVNANNATTVVTFEYGTTTAYGATVTAVQSPVTGTTAKSVNVPLSGLTPNTTYHFRVKAVNTAGTAYGNDFTFTTPAVAPTAQTLDAENITSTGAILKGTVNANNASSVVTFEYGTTTAYGSVITVSQSPVTGTDEAAVNYPLSGLTPNTTYHFRVKAVNAAGATYGNDFIFTTPAVAPTAQTQSANNVSATAATLNGTVNANNASSVVTFEYGTTTSYGMTVSAVQSPVTGTNNTLVNCPVSGLTPNTTYHFRVKAVNAAGTTYGNDSTFTTLPQPAITGILKPTNGTYKAGDNLDFTVNFSKDIAVTGTDSTLSVNIGGDVKQAVYLSKTAGSITYRYTVQAGDLDSDGVTLPANPLTLHTTTVKDASDSNVDASLIFAGMTAEGVLVDSVAPTGTILQGTNRWNSFLNTISFGLFFKQTVTVSITGEDEGGSGVQKIEYYKSSSALSLEGVKGITDWSNYTSALSLTPTDAEKFIVYAKITDNIGNITYISSDGMEFDLSGPSITTDYTKDASSMEVSVTDTGSGVGTVTYTVNGGSAQTANLANGKFTITSLAEGKYDIVITAADVLGNTNNLTVNVVSLYTVTFKLFDSDTGSALKTETVEYGSSATAPPEPSRPGFRFKGWNKTFSIITADTAIHATWDINDITVASYAGTYDGAAHDAVTVTGTLPGDIVTYSINGTDFFSSCPQITGAGSYSVYVRVQREGYTPWESGLKTVAVNKASGSITIVADPTKIYDGSAVLDPFVSKNGSGAVTFTYYTDNAGVPGTELPGAPTAAGTYWVRAAIAQDSNYLEAEDTLKFTINLANISGLVSIPAPVLTGSTITADISGILPAGITFDYQWNLNGTPIDGATDSTYQIKDADYGKELTVVLTANGNYSGSLTSNSVIIGETVAPSGTITEGPNHWNSFLNTISFGLFFKETVSISIIGEDEGGSGIKNIEYYKSAVALSEQEVLALTNWNSYTSAFSVTAKDAEQFVIYAKITDNAGNITVISSDGMKFDLHGPAITTNYAKDANSMEVTVADNGSGVATVTYTVNGGSAQTATLSDEKFTVSLTEGNYDVVVTAQDAIGNINSVTVNVVSLYDVVFKQFSGDTGAALKTQTVEYGGSAEAPANPTRSGFTFKGWDKAFSDIKADTVVNAIWNIGEITVTPHTAVFDGTPHDAVAVTGTLPEDTITYSTNGKDYTAACPQITNAGSYSIYVRVERTGYPAWESGKISIAVGTKDITADMISKIPSAEYTGKPFLPLPEIKFGSVVLVKDTDYTISYSNNTDVGLATVTITGKGNYSGTVTRQFAIYSKNTNVIIGGDQTPQVMTEGLETLYEDKDVYTADDRQIEENGGKVKIELSVEVIADLTEDKAKIEKAAGDKTIGLYLDLSLYKTIILSGETSGDKTKISNLTNVLAITIPIPDNMKGKRGIALYRIHDGVAAMIPEGRENALDGEYCTVDDTNVTLYVRKFSTYAIGYDETKVEAESGTSSGDSGDYTKAPKTGDQTKVFPIIAFAASTVLVLAFAFKRKRKTDMI